MRRVELTHDVLAGVVLASRNLRQEREARDAAQRQLAEQREREAATHRALVRARTIASVCAVLALVSIGSALFGFWSMRRAHAAELEAQASRANAEKLVSFLIEDFYSELAPTGRLDTLGKLAHMTVGYYDSLPPELVTTQTQVNRAMAQVREGAAQNASGDVDAAYRNFGEAQAVFDKLRAAGDTSEDVTYGLALALNNEGFNAVIGGGNGRGTGTELDQAAALLRPLVYGPNPSKRVRQLYADTLNPLSHSQPMEKAVTMCDEARRILVGLGALDLSNLDATSSYADTADSESRHLLSLGRVDEAKTLEQQVYDLADKILAHRPGDLHSLADRSWAAELLGAIAKRQHDDVAAAAYAEKTMRAGEDEVRFNPSDLSAWQRWGSGFSHLSDVQFERGDIAQAIATNRALMALERDPRRPSSLAPMLWFEWIPLAITQARAGDATAAAQSLKAFARDAGEFSAQAAPDNPRRRLMAKPEQSLLAAIQLAQGDAQAAFANASAVIDRLDAVKVPASDVGSSTTQNNMLSGGLRTAATAALRLGHYPQAEALARRWLALPPNQRSEDDPKERSSAAAATLANAVALQGRSDEARAALQPALAYYRQEQQAGANGTNFRGEYAYALYVSALTLDSDPVQRKAALDAATALIQGASPEAQALSDMRQLSGLIASARVAKRA
jgi:tetratricopeptide (TPR) repeat protein